VQRRPIGIERAAAARRRTRRTPFGACIGLRMTLVRIAVSESEPDVALICSALQAADVPHFVHGGGIGGMR
jgi:hypothetical protein